MRIKLWNVNWATTTAGPSPCNNERTEVFLLGCARAKNGNPCKGCFNTKLWDDSIATIDYSSEEIANQIIAHAPNKYVTIGGGEPTDQIEGLSEICRLLKEAGFHIMMYTWRSLKQEFCPDIVNNVNFMFHLANTLQYVDILVDGQFEQDERLYDEEKGDGFANSVGSGNQIIWDLKTYYENFDFKNVTPAKGYAMREIDALALNANDELIYFLKDPTKEPEIVVI